MTQKIITMSEKEISKYEVLQSLIKGQINCTEAGHHIGLSTRQVRRLKGRVQKEGASGLVHKSRGRIGNRKIKKKTIATLKKIVRREYHDFNPTFAAEKLKENHNLSIGIETLRKLMIDWGLWIPRRRKANKEYRSWRQRKERFGEMEQFDGSYHAWFEDRAPECCLLAAIDDATGRLTKLRFTRWEGVEPAFIFWKDYLKKHGKPLSIYLDRHSTYKQNPKKNVLDNPEAVTQFGRAMKELDIRIIHAYSPQAKGRVERLFRTLQDRLVKEMRLQKINDIREANRFLETTFIPDFTSRFSVTPTKAGDLHKPLLSGEKERIDEIFSLHYTRTVLNDFTVRFKNLWLQLDEVQSTLVRRRDRIHIQERLDNSIHLFLRSKELTYTVLPGRPPRAVPEKVSALSRNKSSWKPPADHPWRKSSFLRKSKTAETTSPH
jgi:transposase